MTGRAPAPPAPVCVIVPTFNRLNLLVDALDSLRAQSCPAARILVVDDGSTDGTTERLASMMDVDVLRQANAGKAAALNHALEHVAEPMVWIFDDDDLAHPTALARLHDALVRHPRATFSYGDQDEVRVSANGHRRHRLARPTPPAERLRLATLADCAVHQPGMLVRADALRAAGRFDPTLLRSQDYDMLLRLVRRGEGVRVDGVVFHQRQHDGARGSAARPITGADRAALWPQFDRRIFAGIARDYELGEYLPAAPTSPLTERQQVTALVGRLSVLGRKGLWSHVGADLNRVGDACRRARVDRFDAGEVERLSLLFEQRAAGLATLDMRRLWRSAGVLPARRLRWRLRWSLLRAAPTAARAKARLRWPTLFARLRHARSRLASVPMPMVHHAG